VSERDGDLAEPKEMAESPHSSPVGPLDIEAANELVVENRGWAESIARSVARCWDLDWQMDGLDGAAMEALIFCARRFDPSRGVPFRGYARRRIHEAATEQSRRSRGWRRQSSNQAEAGSITDRAKELSIEVLNVFPELRIGEFIGGDDGENETRASIRELLVGASLIAARDSIDMSAPDDLVDFKRLVKAIAALETIHQAIVWKIYWEGISLRSLAEEWETDGLNVIREHKTILEHLCRSLQAGKQPLTRPKIRPGLRGVAEGLKRDGYKSPFSALFTSGARP
jgi:DNA-directed RNA polymerase specialized sigma subunit